MGKLNNTSETVFDYLAEIIYDYASDPSKLLIVAIRSRKWVFQQINGIRRKEGYEVFNSICTISYTFEENIGHRMAPPRGIRRPGGIDRHDVAINKELDAEHKTERRSTYLDM
ncbi:hypothetical protein BDZ45DRAFT_801021 [Acephala macrosclerotiorum]|nr:hypothetical protein BDZ45DRAFT_801021 [Acephala macrosclerotiorum]